MSKIIFPSVLIRNDNQDGASFIHKRQNMVCIRNVKKKGHFISSAVFVREKGECEKPAVGQQVTISLSTHTERYSNVHTHTHTHTSGQITDPGWSANMYTHTKTHRDTLTCLFPLKPL